MDNSNSTPMAVADSDMGKGNSVVGKSGALNKSDKSDKSDRSIESKKSKDLKDASFFENESDKNALENSDNANRSESDSRSRSASRDEADFSEEGGRDGENFSGQRSDGAVSNSKNGEKVMGGGLPLNERRSRLTNYLIMGGNYVEGKLDSWGRELEALSLKYPAVKIEDCLSDSSFIKMLSCGISVEAAFRTVCFDSIMEAEIARARDMAAASYFAKASRPMENGVSVSSRVKSQGASGFSKNQRAALAARVFNGERIKL